jgi:hypothetical protein
LENYSPSVDGHVAAPFVQDGCRLKIYVPDLHSNNVRWGSRHTYSGFAGRFRQINSVHSKQHSEEKIFFVPRPAKSEPASNGVTIAISFQTNFARLTCTGSDYETLFPESFRLL